MLPGDVDPRGSNMTMRQGARVVSTRPRETFTARVHPACRFRFCVANERRQRSVWAEAHHDVNVITKHGEGEDVNSVPIARRSNGSSDRVRVLPPDRALAI